MSVLIKAWEHFKTITRHRHGVIKNCYKAGILWQGLRHDLSKYSPEEFIKGCNIIKAHVRPMKQSVKNTDFLTAGCITREEISITLNIGRIMTCGLS